MTEQTDNLELPAKASEKATSAPKKKAAAKKSAPKKAAAPRRPTVPLPDGKPLTQAKPEEPVLDPMSIISSAGPMTNGLKTDEEQDAMYNPIEEENGMSNGIAKNEFANELSSNYINEDVVVAPLVRKVAIKKISRFNFRLGMERTVEDYKIVPGASHTWMCDKKGNDFITGLDDKPEERARLERLMRVDLGPQSSFWSSLTFTLEDKPHGQILNFDDRQMGPHYEVVYYAMTKSSMIANGLHEFETGVKPMAEWYIENKEAEAEAKQEAMTYDMEAGDAFKEMSYSRRTGTAKMLGLNVYGVSDKVASTELWEYVRKNTQQAKEFLKVARLKTTEFAVAVLVKDAVKWNVLRKSKTGDITYAGQVLGPTEDHVIAKLTQATNADLRIAIERMVDAKK